MTPFEDRVEFYSTRAVYFLHEFMSCLRYPLSTTTIHNHRVWLNYLEKQAIKFARLAGRQVLGPAGQRQEVPEDKKWERQEVHEDKKWCLDKK